MKDCIIDILGTLYEIKWLDSSEDEHLTEADGYCDYTAKKIVIKSNNNTGLGDFENHQKKSLRHEIIHAMLAESGLQSNFQHSDEFGHDETMVDWVAIQFPKLLKVYQTLNII
jgi:hypothetical protein